MTEKLPSDLLFIDEDIPFEWMPFKDAREFVRGLNLKNLSDWQSYSKSPTKLINIPCNPWNVYKEYISLGDWIGTFTIATQQRKYRSFKDARTYVRTLGLKSYPQWLLFCKSGKLPLDIPRHPRGTYKSEWISSGDWLGTGYVAGVKRKYMPFKEARGFVQKLGLKSGEEWQKYSRTMNRDDLPANPDQVYKSEWVSMGDWLGTGRIANHKRKFRSFRKARAFIHTLGFKSDSEWRRYSSSGKRPDDIPSNPNATYQSEWISFQDWVGASFVATREREYLPFKKAREYAIGLGLKNQSEWFKYARDNKLPAEIPNSPYTVYKKEWVSWGDWLGTGNMRYKQGICLSFRKARSFVHKLNLKSQMEWKKYVKSGKLPINIPRFPRGFYKSEWISEGDWLGTGYIAHKLRIHPSFSEAKATIKKLRINTHKDWGSFLKSPNRLKYNIPFHPERVYSSEWISWDDWLGKA